MKPDGKIKLVGQFLDLPLLDSEGCYCGIVDDVEFEGSLAEGLSNKALLVGPGAYRGRLPAWAFAIVGWIAGHRIVRVEWSEIATIGPTVKLKRPGHDLGLEKAEDRAARWLPHRGAL